MPKKRIKQDIEEVLVTYAESLVRDQPRGLKPTSYPDELSPLIDLSGRLHDTLHPIQPSGEFVSGLNTRLSEGWQLTMLQRKRLIQLTKTMGVIVSLLAVAAVTTQIIGVIIAVVSRSKAEQIEAT